MYTLSYSILVVVFKEEVAVEFVELREFYLTETADFVQEKTEVEM